MTIRPPDKPRNGSPAGRLASGAAAPLAPGAVLRELLDDPQLMVRVRAMPSVLLHRTITGIGLSDSAEILALATPQQVREILDLELWHGDRLKLDEALDWLHFISTSLPDEVRTRDLRALDVELLGYVLKQYMRIYLTEEDAVPDPPEGSLHATPDGWFTLEIMADHTTTVERVIEVVETLYADDQDGSRRLLQNLMWELPTELEEYAYRWRTGRLQDLGFDDPIESLLLYAYLDPASVHPEEGTRDRPLASDPEPSQSTDLVEASLPAADDAFWDRALVAIDEPAERRRLGRGLLYLSNRALSADRVEPADLDGARISLEGLHDRLSLGLEHLCAGELERAPAVLAGVALLRIARVGFSLPLDLRRRLMPALRQGRLGPGPGSVAWLDLPLDAQIRALAAGRPSFFDVDLGDARPFRTPADLRITGGWVERALTSAGLLERLTAGTAGAASAASLEGRGTFGDRFRTVVVNGLLGREGPVDRPALARFIGGHLTEGQLAPRVLEAALTAAVVDAELPRAAEIIRDWIFGLEEALGSLRVDDLDLRFVGGLVLKRGA